MKPFVAILLFILALVPAFAIQPGEALSDPDQEARARALMSELRCLVCQAESVEASPAPFAEEVRALVREQVAVGRSDDEIKRFLTDRYGEEILYRPRLRPGTWLLWLGPFMALGVGGLIVILVIRSSKMATETNALSDEEKARLAALLHENEPPAP